MAKRERECACVLNAEKLDAARTIDLGRLEAAVGGAGAGAVARYEHTSGATETAARASECGATIVVTKEMECGADVIEALPESVKLIVEAGTGYNNIDIEAARQRGITVCSCPAYSSDAVATMVMTFVLSLSCSLTQQQQKLARGDKAGWETLGALPHFELAGKTLGLIGGRGAIGSCVAKMASAFDMKVIVSSRSSEPIEGCEIDTLDGLLARSDFVSVHCPLNAQTRGSIGAEQLARMKRSAYLVNTARGAIIDEAALCKALDDGVIAGAGIDVQEREPPAHDSPLFRLVDEGKLVMTPHIGWQRAETRQRLMDIVAENVEAFLAGEPINVVS